MLKDLSLDGKENDSEVVPLVALAARESMLSTGVVSDAAALGEDESSHMCNAVINPNEPSPACRSSRKRTRLVRLHSL